MYDISLYGHLTRDIIFEDFDRKDSIGSIANVWSDKAVIITGIVLGLIDIALWLKFWRHTTGFSNRHEDGGSSVK